MKTQSTSIASTTSTMDVKNNNKLLSAERMRTANISDNTRDYLIAIGKLSDLYSEICDYVQRDYGEWQVDEIMDGVDAGTGIVRDKLFEFLMFSISENMGLLNQKDI